MARRIVLPDTPEVNRKLMALELSLQRRLLHLCYFHDMQKARAPRRRSAVRARARHVRRGGHRRVRISEASSAR
jgi:hypothetical protein